MTPAGPDVTIRRHETDGMEEEAGFRRWDAELTANGRGRGTIEPGAMLPIGSLQPGDETSPGVED
jgi:hypothetical protein